MTNAAEYGCGGARDGTCDNRVRVSRRHAEATLLDPVRKDLLTPIRVEKIRSEMQEYYRRRMKEMRSKVAEQPSELEELDKRLKRLRGGDPDLTAADLNAAIERLAAQLQEILAVSASNVTNSSMFAMLPQAAEYYRAHVDAGLDGDPAAAARAPEFLHELLGKIRLVLQPMGGLVAHWSLAPTALPHAVRTSGSGGRI